jgi:hypothetical protein
MGRRVSNDCESDTASVTKPRRYSRAAPARKEQHFKPGALHNLHTERTKLQKGVRGELIAFRAEGCHHDQMD